MTHTLDSLKALAARITFPDLEIEVGREEVEVFKCPETNISTAITTGYYLRVHCPFGRCNVSGVATPWKGRKWRLSLHMTDAEVVWTAFKAILTALEHEAREQFKFDGVTVADSHVNIHRLVDFMRDPGNHLERPLHG